MLSGLLLRARRAAKRLPEAGREHNDFTAMADTAEQTRVALPWQQGEARGTLNLPASTKVEDLKLCLNASDCAAVMFDAVIIEVPRGV